MKRVFTVLLFVSAFLNLHSQQYEPNVDVEKIKNNPEYYWAQSRVYDGPVSGADEEAKEELYRNIADNCNPSAIYPDYERDFNYKEHLVKIVSTFAKSFSEKSKYTEVEKRNEYYYFIFIEKSKFTEMCDERHALIQKFADDGFYHENSKTHQLQFSLQNYYWGMIMCMAHPQGKTLTINVNGKTENAYEWFDKHIDGDDGVLKNLTFFIDKKNPGVEKEDCLLLNLRLRTKYGDETPISNINIEYNNGRHKDNITIVDGKSDNFLIYNKTDEKVRIRLNYDFRYKNTNVDVLRVFNVMNPRVNFNHALYDVRIPLDLIVKKSDNKQDKKPNQNPPAGVFKEIEMAFRNKNYHSVRNYFTPEAFGMLDTLMNYGDYTVLNQLNYDTIHFNDVIIFRGLRMNFSFDGTPPFQKEVVFRLDKNSKKITSIAFRMPKATENDINTKSRWSRRSKLTLINFLEDYQTAYVLKRLDYLESIFSDDALIIVGHTVKKTQVPDHLKLNFKMKDVELVKKTKTEYLQGLKSVFAAQEYIDITFTKANFTKKKKSTTTIKSGAEDGYEDIYGVQVLQEYNSTTYGDLGYLFLLVDLREENPLIHVRAWQPDTLGIQLDSLFGLGNIVDK